MSLSSDTDVEIWWNTIDYSSSIDKLQVNLMAKDAAIYLQYILII